MDPKPNRAANIDKTIFALYDFIYAEKRIEERENQWDGGLFIITLFFFFLSFLIILQFCIRRIIVSFKDEA